MANILLTGGAGFIGCNLARKLLLVGETVTVLDNLSEQIHGANPVWPAELRGARTILGSVTDREVVQDALAGQDAVVHLAAETGTGQSMYRVGHYSHANVCGTAVLLDQLMATPNPTVRKLVVASSRAVYGEGAYRCIQHGTVYPRMRAVAEVASGQYEPVCPQCSRPCQSIPTDETAPFMPASFYGLTKQAQEQAVLMFGAHLGLSAYALRFQNVYGPGQSLKNPYTGILAIFSNLARTGQAINLFEDGGPTRDFVYIDDVVESIKLCLADSRPLVNAVYNVGTGQSVSVETVARTVVEHFNSTSPVAVTGQFRSGDIRHNRANISAISRDLGFAPRWSFAAGIGEFLNWAATQPAESDGYRKSLDELKARGLMNARAGE